MLSLPWLILVLWAPRTRSSQSRGGPTKLHHRWRMALGGLVLFYALGILVTLFVFAVIRRGRGAEWSPGTFRTMASIGVASGRSGEPLIMLVVMHAFASAILVRGCFGWSMSPWRMKRTSSTKWLVVALLAVILSPPSIYSALACGMHALYFVLMAPADHLNRQSPKIRPMRWKMGRLVLALMQLVSTAYVIAHFVFRWAWIRDGKASHSTAANLLLGSNAGSEQHFASLLMVSAWIMVRRDVVSTDVVVPRLPSSVPADLLYVIAITSSMSYATICPGIMSLGMALVSLLASIRIGGSRLQQSVAIVAASYGMFVLLASIIHGTIRNVSGCEALQRLGVPIMPSVWYWHRLLLLTAPTVWLLVSRKVCVQSMLRYRWACSRSTELLLMWTIALLAWIGQSVPVALSSIAAWFVARWTRTENVPRVLWLVPLMTFVAVWTYRCTIDSCLKSWRSCALDHPYHGLPCHVWIVLTALVTMRWNASTENPHETRENQIGEAPVPKES